MITLTIKGGQEAIDRLNKLASGGVGAGAQKALDTYGLTLLALAQENSPVDSGTFLQNWSVERTTTDGSVAAIELTNNLPYAGPLEYGSPAGKRPWPSAGPKTVLEAGRIWSSQAPLGILMPELEGIADDAAKAVLGEITEK